MEFGGIMCITSACICKRFNVFFRLFERKPISEYDFYICYRKAWKMEHKITIADLLLKSIAVLTVIVISGFLMFGWLKGLNMERELKRRR